MNVFSSSSCKYSAILLPLLALCLVQIQGFDEKWREHFQPESDFPPMGDLEKYGDYYKNQYNSIQDGGKQGSRSMKNASSRDYTEDDSKTISLSSMSNLNLPKPNVVAYRRTLHNVSWAVTIPLFTFLLPIAGSGDPVTLGNQALYGFFSALIVIIGFGVPILFNGQIPNARSLNNNKITLSHLMHPGHIMNLGGLNMENRIGIDPIKCLQKTVCEAYRSPQNEKYGMLAWPVRYFFPAKNVSDGEARSIYELAARDGKYTDTRCGKKYNCMFDVLDLASYFISVYKRSRKEVKRREGDGDEMSLQNI